MTYWADEDMDDPEVLGSVSWDHEQSGHSQTGVNELTAIVGAGHGFETVKPMKLMTKIIQIWCPPNGTVLDLFAGSGTTGHVVLKLNHDQGACLLYTSDAADERSSVDLGGRRIIKKKTNIILSFDPHITNREHTHKQNRR